MNKIMTNFSRYKKGILHPNLALKFLLRRKEYKIAARSYENKLRKRLLLASKYFGQHKALVEYNQKNSKFPLYFDLCKRILTDTVSDESLRKKFFRNPDSITESEIIQVMKETQDKKFLVGTFGPKRTHTMIGFMKLESLQFFIEDIIKNNVEGDLIETGVWRGGSTIFMRMILKKYEIMDKIVYVADSFEGLPKPNVEKFPQDYGDKFYTRDDFKVSLEEVKNNFKMYGVLDEQVKFIKGFFENTMKKPPMKKLSVLRMDGDMYGSTWIVLENLYEKLSIGGYLIIDDYGLPACRKAVHDFRKLKNINDPIIRTNHAEVYWKKAMQE